MSEEQPIIGDDVVFDTERNPAVQIRIWLPLENYKLLLRLESERGLPMSRLMLIAFDNEMDQAKPFNYPLDWDALPPYEEFKYAKEAANMLEFLSRTGHGVGLDHLILMRRQYGIVDRELAMLSYRELKMSGMVEEYWPRRAKFSYPKDYRYVRVVLSLRKTLGNKKFKRFEDERRYTKKGWRKPGGGE